MKPLNEYLIDAVNEAKNVRLDSKYQTVVNDEISKVFEHILEKFVTIDVKNPEYDKELALRIHNMNGGRIPSISAVYTTASEISNDPEKAKMSLLDKSNGYAPVIADKSNMFIQKNNKAKDKYRCEVSVFAEIINDKGRVTGIGDVIEITSSKNKYDEGNVSVKIIDDAYGTVREGVTMRFTYTYPKEWINTNE